MLPPAPPYFTAATTVVVASSGLLLCLPREMLANPPTPSQQMKQALAPRGRCTGQTMQSLMFFMSQCGGTRGGRTLMEATGGCGNVCRSARGYLTPKSNTCKMRDFSCREKINIIDPWGGIGDVSAGERWMVRPGVERQAVIKNLKANSESFLTLNKVFLFLFLNGTSFLTFYY